MYEVVITTETKTFRERKPPPTPKFQQKVIITPSGTNLPLIV